MTHHNEIERKFLVVGDAWRDQATGLYCCQGYISTAREGTVRVRIMGDKAFLTIKGLRTGISRNEYEYEIPTLEARQMLTELCAELQIEKTRYEILVGKVLWEVDEFHGQNEGLIIAEVELEHEHQIVELPKWVGQEVSKDRRYYNSHLARHPFRHW